MRVVLYAFIGVVLGLLAFLLLVWLMEHVPGFYQLWTGQG